MTTELAGIVGPENVLSGEEAARRRVSGVAPACVAAPRRREEAAQVILLAAERGWSMVPAGGGTLLDFGFPPARLDLLLSTRNLNRVVDYQPDDMTVTVEAGVTLAQLAETLAARGQLLPLDPPLPEKATVGGTVAAAATGPWRAGFGTPRDWVIGCRVVGADGREVRGGGQVVKNVAGYDLPKLYTGSFGTLGLITEVTFKVFPRPDAEAGCTVGLREAKEAEPFVAAVMASDLQPTVLDLDGQFGKSDSAGWQVVLQFMHAREAVEWQLAETEKLATRHGLKFRRIHDAIAEGVVRGLAFSPGVSPFVTQIGTLSSRVADLAGEVAAQFRKVGIPPRVVSHAATGQVVGCGPSELEPAPEPEAVLALAADLRALARDAGATCVFPRLPDALYGRVDPWGEVGPELRLMSGIKVALDPHGMFSPGRFAGGL